MTIRILTALVAASFIAGLPGASFARELQTEAVVVYSGYASPNVSKGLENRNAVKSSQVFDVDGPANQRIVDTSLDRSIRGNGH